jgi:hypothetical protein
MRLASEGGSMKLPKLKAIGLGIALFVAVYVPAFTTTALVRHARLDNSTRAPSRD